MLGVFTCSYFVLLLAHLRTGAKLGCPIGRSSDLARSSLEMGGPHLYSLLRRTGEPGTSTAMPGCVSMRSVMSPAFWIPLARLAVKTEIRDFGRVLISEN